MWCPTVPGVGAPDSVGDPFDDAAFAEELGVADSCLYVDAGLAAVRWSETTVTELEEAYLNSDRFTANDGEYAYFYWDDESMIGCAMHETADTVYGACAWVDAEPTPMLALHQAIKDAVG